MQIQSLPELGIVRVLTPGGPYRSGETLSIAFATPTVGRFVLHERTLDISVGASPDTLVPETISAIVTHAAHSYALGDVVVLSFVDPRVGRVHPHGDRTSSFSEERTAKGPPRPSDGSLARPIDAPIASESNSAATSRAFDLRPHERVDRQSDATAMPPQATTAMDDPGSIDVGNAERASLASTPPYDYNQAAPKCAVGDDEPCGTADVILPSSHATRSQPELTVARTGGVRVALEWNGDRVRRFVQVVDKLFTVGRLGWYRHALAMRLLIPDEVTCGDALADVEAMRHLHALRAAAVETLGRPLLAAFMPSFAVSSDWLATIDSPVAARALAGLRDALTPYVEDGVVPAAPDPSWTAGTIQRFELLGTSASSVESLLPVLIPTRASSDEVTEQLTSYRQTLIDVFGQTASCVEAVRLNQMAQPNHALDDRLWRLVGAVGEAFDGLAVA